MSVSEILEKARSGERIDGKPPEQPFLHGRDLLRCIQPVYGAL